MQQLKTLDLLNNINSSADVRALDIEQLPELCQEIRDYLIDTVSKTAGHLASGLAVVELTVALHYVFDTPEDKIIWDVGHQSYPHKILTGHRKELATIRKKDGLHAFIWRGETDYDVLSTGHASTSIGSALGLAVAARNQNQDKKVVAVIGDGALSGGAAYEAMNNAGSIEGLNMLVILNDNEMSISSNVGSVAQGLSRILTNPHYVKLIKGGHQVLKKLPAIHEIAKRAEEHVKGMVMPGTLFEELGFNYIGPVDGHDVKGLVNILGNLKSMTGLQFLHIVTRKGKGYGPAEQDPTRYHGVPVFDPELGISSTTHPAGKSFSAGFGKWICDMAAKDTKLVGITPAMTVGSAMQDFSCGFKDRFFDVGIAEQHAMIFASGLAAGGMHPVVNIYSSFLQRAYDGVIHDFAIQDIKAMLVIDRGGIVGPDGPTHQGLFDIAYLRTVPNLVIMVPSTLDDQYRMLNTGYRYDHPCVVRFPRCNGKNSEYKVSLDETVEIGKSRTIVSGKRVAILSFGPLGCDLEPLCREEGWTLVDMRFVKPLDYEIIRSCALNHELIVTLEEGMIEGGIGQEVGAFILRENISVRVITAGVPDEFIHEATRDEILSSLKLDAAGIKTRISEFFSKKQ